MGHLKVGKVSDFQEKGRRIVAHGDFEIGVFLVDGEFYAYKNVCVHQGGPVCRGKIMNRVVELLGEDQVSKGLEFSPDDVHIVCPWHGYEFNLKTGVHPGKSDVRLKSYPVKVEGGDVFVVI